MLLSLLYSEGVAPGYSDAAFQADSIAFVWKTVKIEYLRRRTGLHTASQGSLYRPPGECYGKRKKADATKWHGVPTKR